MPDYPVARTRRSIEQLEAIVDNLAPNDRLRFERLFAVSVTVGKLDAPASMHGWIEKLFGSVAAVEAQTIVKTTNLWTFEGALFNALRSSRPIEFKDTSDLTAQIVSNQGDKDPFCVPERLTPSDTFGRIRGKHSITASNIAKYDGFHGLVVFDEHNPLHIAPDSLTDYFDVALRWGHAAHEADPLARYFFFMWNCLWKSGASVIHGHAQMALSRDIHYGRIENLRRLALAYQREHGINYFDDLYACHASLGLATTIEGVRALVYLTPTKEKEIILLGDALDERLAAVAYRVLNAYVNAMGVTSFNLVVAMPPIAEAPEDWTGFPVMLRLVDRGDPMSKTSDIGAMELYASSVISSDPFAIFQLLTSYN